VLPALYPYMHDASDPVLITHSSGTTGVPKAVPMHHDNFFAGIDLRLRIAVPKVMERVLCALPPAHNSAITNFAFSLLAGLPVQLMSTQDATAVLRAIEDFRPTMVTGFSTTFAELCQHDLDARYLDSVQLWWNSGDAAHERHIRRLQNYGSHYKVERTGISVQPGSAFTDALGSSEMGHSLFNSLHMPGAPITPRCFGLPLDFVDAAVLGPDGRKLPAGQVGMLGIKSPTLTKGYWNDSLKSARARLAGYWLTGDLVAQDERGQFYHYDRVTDAISTAQGTLYSVQAEELILRHVPEIADCTVIGSDTADGTQVAHAYLQPDREVDLAVFDGIDWTTRINELLAAHGLVAIGSASRLDKEDLVLGPTGKVKKRELRERFAATAAGSDHAGA
jgi:acyl-coenzyme A synthetase/AMP-(fatty) acid ligase